LINIIQYKKLCKLFDKVLLSKLITPNIVSNTWLHIQRPQGDFLEKYSHIFKKESITRFWIRMLKLVFRYTAISVFRLFQSITIYRRHCDEICSDGVDVLLVSHLVNSETNCEKDMYYYDVPDQLNNRGLSTMVALIDHNKIPKKLNNKSLVPRVLLKKTLSFVDELSLYFSQLRAVIFFNTGALGSFFNKRIRMEASIRMMSSGSFSSLRISKQLSKIISKVNPKYLVFTYEGHAWERLACYEARQINPAIRCFAYQHSSLFAYQHSMKRELLPAYNADVILTSGSVSKDQFEVIFKLPKIPIYNIGSAKSHKFSINKILPSESDTFLVIPEGIISECIALFEFSLMCAKSLPNYKFIWRLHPIISFNQIFKKNNIFTNLPNNIYLSNKSLEKDIKSCDNVIYRGSTAVINAINAGLRPIYYSEYGMIPNDLLFQKEKGKLIVSNVEDFRALTSAPINKIDQKELIKFSNFFYTPLDYSLLISLFNKNKINSEKS